MRSVSLCAQRNSGRYLIADIDYKVIRNEALGTCTMTSQQPATMAGRLNLLYNSSKKSIYFRNKYKYFCLCSYCYDNSVMCFIFIQEHYYRSYLVSRLLVYG